MRMRREVEFALNSCALRFAMRRVGLTLGTRRLSTAACAALNSYKGEHFPFRVSLDVQFADMDCFRHVNNARYFTFFETARCKIWQEVGLPLLTAARMLSLFMYLPPGISWSKPALIDIECVAPQSLITHP